MAINPKYIPVIVKGFKDIFNASRKQLTFTDKKADGGYESVTIWVD